MKANRKLTIAVIVTAAIVTAGAAGSFLFFSKTDNKALNAVKAFGEDGSTAAFAEAFSAEDYDGNSYGSGIFGKADVTVVNIWATDCGGCIEEMPGMNELAPEYEEKGLQIVGMCTGLIGQPFPAMDEEKRQAIRNDAEEILASIEADNYLQVIPSDDFNLSYLEPILISYPTTVVIDRNGEIIDMFAGGMNKSMWAKRLDKYLAQVQG